MNDLKYAEQELLQAKRLLKDWIMKGYDTPTTTYHEQLEMYETRVKILTEKISQDLI